MTTQIDGTTYLLATETCYGRTSEYVCAYVRSEMHEIFGEAEIADLQAGKAVTMRFKGGHTVYRDMVAATRNAR